MGQSIRKDGTVHSVAEIGVLGSIRHIIAAMIGEKASELSSTTINNCLCLLANKEFVTIRRGENGRWTWVAKPKLLRYDSRAGRFRTRKDGPVKIRMDDALKRDADKHYAVLRVRKGRRAKRHEVTARWLISQELHHQAISYVDAKGRLAWKAVDADANNVIQFPTGSDGRKQLE